jgi:AcrR family transcriptional regulator
MYCNEMAVSRQVEKRTGAKNPDLRANQRARTRAAIMEATRQLIREGKVPTIAEAAAEARVSRATAYRYFPTQGALVREAVDAVLIQPVEWDERLGDVEGGLEERLASLAGQMFELIADNEPLLRGALLLSLEQWAKLQAGEELGEEPIQRGGRRGGIKSALEPFEDKLDDETLRRLAIALAVIVGVEAHVVMRDIWHLDDEEAKSVTAWMTRAVAQAALPDRGSKARKSR